MALLDSIGESLLVGSQAIIHGVTVTFSSYIVSTATDGGKNVEMEDIDNADGTLSTRLIYKRQPKVSLELICEDDANPLADFPEGDMSVLTGLTAYFVDSAKVSKSKSAAKVSLELTNIGIT